MSELGENVAFPVYVLAKDCGDVMEFPSWRSMQAYLEPIDVENGEYEAWDGNGSLIAVSVTKLKSAWLNIVTTQDRISAQEFSELKSRAEIPKSIRS